MSSADIIFTAHAVTRMFERQIAVADVLDVLATGTVIERHRMDAPRPSTVTLGWVVRDGERKPVHVVSADDPDGRTVVITVYRPDPALWNADFTRRKS